MKIFYTIWYHRSFRRLRWKLASYLPGRPNVEFGARVEQGAICEGEIKNILIKQGAGVRSGAWLSCLDRNSRIIIESGTLINRWAKIVAAGGTVHIGQNCSIHSFDVLYGFEGGLHIGNSVRIATNVSFVSANYLFDDLSFPVGKQGSTSKGIVIEDYVWIGAGAIILDGVTIGKNSVIGAGSVVAKSVPPESVCLGIPARVVRARGTQNLTRN